MLLLARWLGGGFKLYHRTQLPWLCTTRRDGLWYGRREGNDICIARVIAVVAQMQTGRRALHTRRLLMPNGHRSILVATVRTSTPDMATRSWVAPYPLPTLPSRFRMPCHTANASRKSTHDTGPNSNLTPVRRLSNAGNGTYSAQHRRTEILRRRCQRTGLKDKHVPHHDPTLVRHNIHVTPAIAIVLPTCSPPRTTAASWKAGRVWKTTAPFADAKAAAIEIATPGLPGEISSHPNAKLPSTGRN